MQASHRVGVHFMGNHIDMPQRLHRLYILHCHRHTSTHSYTSGTTHNGSGSRQLYMYGWHRGSLCSLIGARSVHCLQSQHDQLPRGIRRMQQCNIINIGTIAGSNNHVGNWCADSITPPQHSVCNLRGGIWPLRAHCHVVSVL